MFSVPTTKRKHANRATPFPGSRLSIGNAAGGLSQAVILYSIGDQVGVTIPEETWAEKLSTTHCLVSKIFTIYAFARVIG